MQVSRERTGWRDAGLSLRHRRWGIPNTAIDLDFILLEYIHDEPRALVEYKHEDAELAFPSEPRWQALTKLGNRADLPVFGCRYSGDYLTYKVTPLNDCARKHLSGAMMMSEAEWAHLLYKLRGINRPVRFIEEDLAEQDSIPTK